jgi:predicted metal-dependent hydrolase
MDLKKTAGREPTKEAVIALQATEAKIAEIRATLADRLEQAETIAGRAAVKVASASDATKTAQEKAKPLTSPRPRRGKARADGSAARAAEAKARPQ